jgi:RNA polymerase sigma-70 factor (ECF subfamily)
LTADTAHAEDLTSIVFLETWRRRADVTLRAEESLPWLYGVATNVIRNQRRSQRRYAAALARVDRPRDEPDFSDDLGGRLDDETKMREILNQLGGLSSIDREVLALCVWHDLTPREAAVALSIPEVTVRTRLHRARRHLRELDNAGPDAVPRRPEATQGGVHEH